jgi:hypothetical protein
VRKKTQLAIIEPDPPPAPALPSEVASADGPIDQVLRWIVEGQADGDILATIAETWPHEDPEDLYQKAVEQVAGATQVDPDVILGWCFMARRELYRKMLENGDFAGALRATEKIESLIEKLK